MSSHSYQLALFKTLPTFLLSSHALWETHLCVNDSTAQKPTTEPAIYEPAQRNVRTAAFAVGRQRAKWHTITTTSSTKWPDTPYAGRIFSLVRKKKNGRRRATEFIMENVVGVVARTRVIRSEWCVCVCVCVCVFEQFILMDCPSAPMPQIQES